MLASSHHPFLISYMQSFLCYACKVSLHVYTHVSTALQEGVCSRLAGAMLAAVFALQSL